MNLPLNRRSPKVALLAVLVIAGILAVIILPRYTRASQGVAGPTIQELLHTIRTQIELYNVQHPATSYWAGTATPGFWDPLVQGGYLPAEPGNPLQNGSSVVGSGPGVGLGWVWAEAQAGDTWTLNLYAVDENGNLYDGDGNGLPD